MSKIAIDLINREKKLRTGKLDLGRTGLKEIPSELYELVWLEELSFANSLYSYSTGTALYSKNLGENNFLEIDKLPDEFSKFKNLKKLKFGKDDIDDTQWEVTDCSVLSKLVNLEELELANNKIVDLSFLYNLVHLKKLEIGNNKINDISVLKRLTSLEYLEIYLSKIDTQILSDLTELKFLNIHTCKLIDISFLEKLDNLEHVYLGNNNIKDLSSIRKLRSLKTLFVNNNEITDISCLSELKSLEKICMSENKIEDISPLTELTNLYYISLESNKIQDLQPLKFHICNGLVSAYDAETFFHDNDSEEDFPFEERNQLLIGRNPLKNPPMSILQHGHKSVVEWFEQMERGYSPLFESKVMILGQGGAGKTTLRNLLVDDNYEVCPGKEDSTLGIEIQKGVQFTHKSKKNVKIKANLWDFGGQNIQKMLHQFFITEDCLYILVHDKRKENTNFDYWFQIINLLGPKSSVLVLENPKEIDSTNHDFPINKYRDQFPGLTIKRHEVNLQKIKREHNLQWQCFVDDIEHELSNIEIVNRSIPLTWTLVRKELDSLVHLKYITKDDFYRICLKDNINMSKEHADLCLYYLNSLGDLVYFNDHGLSTNIYLDHNWLTYGLYYILSDPSIKKNNGKFSRDMAYHKWNEHGYKESEKEMLLCLLLKNKFDLCYNLTNTNNYITPILLPNDKLKKWDFETKLYFSYRYAFMPHGIFSRLIVRLHEYIDSNDIWETGMRLRYEYKDEIIYSDIQHILNNTTGQKTIEIKISGGKEGCKDLLSKIRYEISQLHKDFLNISFTEFVACSCENCKKLLKEGDTPSFYDYAMLQKKIKSRKYFQECENSNYDQINIGAILSDIIIENSAKDNIDIEIVYHLKEIGLSINNITQISNNNVGNSSSTSSAKSEAIATSTVSIEINNLLGETEMLKEDIEDEKKVLLKELDNDDIDITLKDITKIEKSLSEIVDSEKQGVEPTQKNKNRLKRFMDDFSNEDSTLFKVLKGLRKGKEYGVSIAETYNSIAENIGLPLVPPLALKLIKKI